ncbi:MAG TPA: hypothetical protein EYH34_13280 [Planctomycetes bacterium]|nr:hypothetical protein [Planctomycetota bacterium]
MFRRKRLLLVVLLAVAAACFASLGQEKILYERQSAYNTILVTEDGRGMRTLYFERGGVRQSVVKPDDPDLIELAYARAMPVGLAFVEEPRRVLIIGLGGGTIPSFLHKHYPQTIIDVVDIDPEVVAVAKQFFGFREDALMKAYVQDGRRFVERCRSRYDIVFLDAFGPDSIPYHLATREFLTAVRGILAPGGIVVGNVWSRSSNRLYDSMILTYQDVFEAVYILDVRGAGNKIIFGLPRAQPVDRLELARRASRISRTRRFPFDMGEAVLYGFHAAAEEILRGTVLRDRVEAPSPR